MNLGLKEGGVLVHCGAGVSRVCPNIVFIVSYNRDCIPYEHKKNEFPPGSEFREEEAKCCVPEFRLRTPTEKI